mgnify:CR=1 FL=1
MKLYSAASSPYARKVMVVLHETGQFDDVEVVPVYGSPTNPDTMPLAKNPLGKLPALERADGPALYDSRVICSWSTKSGCVQRTYNSPTGSKGNEQKWTAPWTC